jgi:hypothetical protein
MAIAIGARSSILVSLTQQQESCQKRRQAAGDRHQGLVGNDQGIDEAANQNAQDQVSVSVE